jgi:hypothetical protein
MKRALNDVECQEPFERILGHPDDLPVFTDPAGTVTWRIDDPGKLTLLYVEFDGSMRGTVFTGEDIEEGDALWQMRVEPQG